MLNMEYANSNLANSNLWSLVSSVLSSVLALVAISLSLYFFVQSRNVQENVSTTLAEIKTQAGVLQKITFKQLDRLTRFVTERPGQQSQQLDRLATSTSRSFRIICSGVCFFCAILTFLLRPVTKTQPGLVLGGKVTSRNGKIVR